MSDVAFIYPITPATPMGEYADQWATEGRRNLHGNVMQARVLRCAVLSCDVGFPCWYALGASWLQCHAGVCAVLGPCLAHKSKSLEVQEQRWGLGWALHMPIPVKPAM